MCVNFIHKRRDLQLKVESERQIFWETFHGYFIFLSELLPEICWEEIGEEVLFVFDFDVWPGARTLTLRLISQHTTLTSKCITRYISINKSNKKNLSFINFNYIWFLFPFRFGTKIPINILHYFNHISRKILCKYKKEKKVIQNQSLCKSIHK